LTRQRSGRILGTVWEVFEARQKRIETSELNRFLEAVIRQQPPRSHDGGTGKIYFATQVETAPPTFVLSVNSATVFARHYLRFLNNRLREEYGFTGNRIFLRLKEH
jgi:GTP-binding protein